MIINEKCSNEFSDFNLPPIIISILIIICLMKTAFKILMQNILLLTKQFHNSNSDSLFKYKKHGQKILKSLKRFFLKLSINSA